MKNLIEQLYNGNIYPAQEIVPADPRYRPVSLKTGAEREKLKKKLSEEDARRLDELHDMYMETESMTCYAGFSYGFQLGLMLLVEIVEAGKD